jgi:hypothetical protein
LLRSAVHRDRKSPDLAVSASECVPAPDTDVRGTRGLVTGVRRGYRISNATLLLLLLAILLLSSLVPRPRPKQNGPTGVAAMQARLSITPRGCFEFFVFDSPVRKHPPPNSYSPTWKGGPSADTTNHQSLLSSTIAIPYLVSALRHHPSINPPSISAIHIIPTDALVEIGSNVRSKSEYP